MASYVIGLAMNSGWTEQFILEELPLSKGLQYLHAALYANGAKTIPTEAGMERQLDDIRSMLDGN